LADLDGDEDLDLFSGSITGRMFWFPREAGWGFGARRTLGTRHGEPLFVRQDVEKRATALAVADWDGDGDADLVVGNIEGWVFWIENEGSARDYRFARPVRLAAEGVEIAAGGGDAGPALGDWDGDGDLDLLVGAGDGSVTLFRNRGSRTRPRLAEPELLLPAVPGIEDGTARLPAGSRACGSRTKPCVADWNGDGLADLLVGDFQLELHPEPAATGDRDQQRRDRMEYEQALAARAELGIHALQQLVMDLESPVDHESARQRAARESELAEARHALAQKSAANAKLEERLDAARAKVPREYSSHGYVWLFLRRAPPVR